MRVECGAIGCFSEGAVRCGEEWCFSEGGVWEVGCFSEGVGVGRSGASVRVGYGEVGHIHNTSVHLHCMCLRTSLPPSPRPPCSLHCNDTAVCDRKEEEEDFQGEQHSVWGGRGTRGGTK